VKVKYINIKSDKLIDPMSSDWSQVEAKRFDLMPAPLGMVQDLSPLLALSKDHGKVKSIQAQVVHNGKELSLRLSWENKTKNDAIVDLNEFTDGVAVMFPLSNGANAITMGDENNPVNAWLWKSDEKDPYDVIAHGYSTSQRRAGEALGLSVSTMYENGRWNVVFQRRLRSNLINHKQVNFTPNKKLGLAFAVWDGGNNDRSGRKALLPMWQPLEIEA